MAKRGWQRESARHSLAARGVRTRTPRKSWLDEKGCSMAEEYKFELGHAAGSKQPEMLIWPNPEANRQADAVLNWFKHDKHEIDAHLKRKHSEFNLLIIPFLNGRERGYTAVLGDKQVSWCEHRNVDYIRVYPFDWFKTESERDSDFETKTKGFRHDDGEAYKFILNELGLPYDER